MNPDSRRCRAFRVAILLLICGAAFCGTAAPAAAVDATETTRLMLQSGLLAAAERPRQRFVEAFEALSADDPALAAATERPMALKVAVGSTFPPAQVRERWLRELTARLDTDAFVAARAFFASIPGQTVAAALRDGFRDGFPRAGRAAPGTLDQVPAGGPTRAQFGLLTDAGARDLVIDAHAHAMALWAVRRLAAAAEQEQHAVAPSVARSAPPERAPDLQPAPEAALETARETRFEAAFDRVLEESLSVLAAASDNAGTGAPAADNADALAPLPAPYRDAFLEFAFSDAGDRFFTTTSIALEAALRQLARAQAGYFIELMQSHPPAMPLETP